MGGGNPRLMRRAKEFRLQRGLRQADVAAHLGITQEQVGHFETCRSHLSAPRLMLLSALLDATPQSLLEEVARPRVVRRTRLTGAQRHAQEAVS